MSDEQVGHIQLAGNIDAFYSGVRVAEFATVEDLNTWAETHPGYLVIRIDAMDGRRLLVLYSKRLTADEQQWLEEWGVSLDAFMRKKRAEKEQSEWEAGEAKRTEEAEAKRLAELGRKCEENHKKFYEEKRAARKGKHADSQE